MIIRLFIVIIFIILDNIILLVIEHVGEKQYSQKYNLFSCDYYLLTIMD